MKSAHLGQALRTRAQGQMQGVGEDSSNTHRTEKFGRHSLDGSIGSNGEKERGFVYTMRRPETARAPGPILSQHFKFHDGRL